MKTKIYKGAYSGAKKKCVFCKHWWDPANSALTPLKIGGFEFDPNEQRECDQRNNSKTRANFTCNKFESKINF